MNKHTPTPWASKSANTHHKTAYITAPDESSGGNWIIANVLHGDDDARFIVTACNSHDELLEALNRLTIAAGEADALQHAGLKVPPKVWSEIYDANIKARAAIANATKE